MIEAFIVLGFFAVMVLCIVDGDSDDHDPF